jgi:hypothetical protein
VTQGSHGARQQWLTPVQLDAWKSLTVLMARLPAALEEQLKRDAQLSYLEYYVLAGLSAQPGQGLLPPPQIRQPVGLVAQRRGQDGLECVGPGGGQLAADGGGFLDGGQVNQ